MEPKQSLVKLNAEQMAELTQYLLGSSHTLDEFLDAIGGTFEQLYPSSFDNIDARIFHCDWCGYWYDIAHRDAVGEDFGASCCDGCVDLDIPPEDDEEDFIDNEDSALDDGDDA